MVARGKLLDPLKPAPFFDEDRRRTLRDKLAQEDLQSRNKWMLGLSCTYLETGIEIWQKGWRA